ncbi:MULTISPECIES: hypothetical protein [unclassified Streptomyces]|uniref:Uncharacterized protein n=1 Tax=Streptomyces sp. R33 TaxID=3238629 RepID=A0AB39Y5E0_9ACTN|nr:MULTISPECIES: hypothetical protein [unclassified Streptomyces]KJY46021.1 hypothetical protein VR46_11475 [Streptomyces sp. NRRL S-444]KOY54712.1 hypothetical protein ADK59_28795 [Streptomyces sp. XY332]
MEVVAVRRGAVRSVVVAGLLVLGVSGVPGVPGVPGTSGRAEAWTGPEADVAYHGRVSLSQGRLRVWVVPQNEGPAALPNATLRVRLSAELADRQELAEGCARAGLREVVCETGELPLHGRGRHIGLLLELKERQPEVVVRIDTWWNGGASDRDLSNNQHAVLALDTGDAYAF